MAFVFRNARKIGPLIAKLLNLSARPSTAAVTRGVATAVVTRGIAASITTVVAPFFRSIESVTSFIRGARSFRPTIILLIGVATGIGVYASIFVSGPTKDPRKRTCYVCIYDIKVFQFNLPLPLAHHLQRYHANFFENTIICRFCKSQFATKKARAWHKCVHNGFAFKEVKRADAEMKPEEGFSTANGNGLAAMEVKRADAEMKPEGDLSTANGNCLAAKEVKRADAEMKPEGGLSTANSIWCRFCKRNFGTKKQRAWHKCIHDAVGLSTPSSQ